MEHRPNSGPEKGENYFKQQSPDIGPEEQSFPLTEYITIYNATKIWEGPRYPAYNSRAARLRSYTEWPHGLNPSPSSLSTVGFYFIGKRPNYFWTYTMSSYHADIQILDSLTFRWGRFDSLFSLRGSIGRMAHHLWCIHWARSVVSELCLCTLYKGRRIHPWLPEIPQGMYTHAN